MDFFVALLENPGLGDASATRTGVNEIEETILVAAVITLTFVYIH